MLAASRDGSGGYLASFLNVIKDMLAKSKMLGAEASYGCIFFVSKEAAAHYIYVQQSSHVFVVVHLRYAC